jgi:hypothetical protein
MVVADVVCAVVATSTLGDVFCFGGGGGGGSV